jgi:glycosyltransferase involved in cell wall biosynthesis
MRVGVVVPCYKVRDSIFSVIQRIGDEVSAIYVVEDCCPDQTANFIEVNVTDPRLRIVRHGQNTGVGGAVKSGYHLAMADGMDIVVKIDGDGQMDPSLVPHLIRPILRLDADYVKGNRFYSFYSMRNMPPDRLIGNAILSFMTKFSSGYWRVFDPTNGLTAISSTAAKRINFNDVSDGYFFETDMLIQLGAIRAVVQDFPMEALYGAEVSNLKIRNIALEFLGKHIKASVRRVIYHYFLRDFSIASVNLVVGIVLGLFGVTFGAVEWYKSISAGIPASSGTVMVAVLPIILGVQLLIAFLSQDIGNEPTVPLVKMTDGAILSADARPDGRGGNLLG